MLPEGQIEANSQYMFCYITKYMQQICVVSHDAAT